MVASGIFLESAYKLYNNNANNDYVLNDSISLQVEPRFQQGGVC